MGLIKRGKNYAKSEKDDLKNIWIRIKKRDFSGNTGQVVKNSVYQFSTNLIMKIGALIFTIIIARLLMPELFGLYSLALSTIGFFLAFSDLGLGKTLIRFLSLELSKKKPNTKGYYNHLIKIKFFINLIVALILMSSSYWMSNNYYNKPIFYALLAGGLYIFINGFINFFVSFFQSYNNFRRPLIKEIIFQILRIIIIPLIILYSLSLGEETLLLNIVLGLSFCYLIVLVFLIIKKPVLSGKGLNKGERKKTNKFVLPLTITILSGVFFNYIDRIMLGHFVEARFIGYYSAAFSLVSAIMGLLAFSVVLLPIFSRLKKRKLLNRAMKKSIRMVLPFSLSIVLLIIFLAPLVIKIIYGAEYFNAINLLKLFSLLIISGPITAIYLGYFIAQGKTKLIARLLITTTFLNIILNYLLITFLVKKSDYLATIGAIIATLVSRYLYLGLFVLNKNK